MNLTREGLGQR